MVDDEGEIGDVEKHDEVGERIEVEAIDRYEGVVDIVDDKRRNKSWRKTRHCR